MCSYHIMYIHIPLLFSAKVLLNTDVFWIAVVMLPKSTSRNLLNNTISCSNVHIIHTYIAMCIYVSRTRIVVISKYYNVTSIVS